ncbi:MAG: YfhO family protein [Acidimicrobiales bacterium]
MSKLARLWRKAPGPLLAVTAVVAWNLWSLRSVVLPVVFLNDGSVHEMMARYASSVISSGKDPYTSWFPYIGLGSAQYLHYQSLGSVLTGLVGVVVGPDTAFRWSVYLLLSLWPFVIYSSARLFGLPRGTCAIAAALSPLVVSFTGVGYERGAYLWIGGAEVWTQLVGSWALPFAWAASWRAMRDARYLWLAAAVTGLTVALHFMSGDLAFLGVIVVALVAEGPLLRRLGRAAVLFVASLAAAAWVIVPLILFTKWSAINQELATTGYVRGYGARQEVVWLFTGRIFDAHRAIPAITIAALLGVVLAIVKWRREPLMRALVTLLVASLLLSFGPTTWGPLADLVPGHADLYFRRFMMGSQLAGLYLAGLAIVAVWNTCTSTIGAFATSRRTRFAALSAVTAGLVACFWPAAKAVSHYDQRNAAAISYQRSEDASQGAEIGPLLTYIKDHGGGRTYAGQSINWGQEFTVGYVPVYKYIESQDIDEVAYTVPSLSLMLDPEIEFDEDDPADYALFGVRYMLLPTGMAPPVPAQRALVDANYSLWVIASNSYIDLVQVTGTVSADRADIGSKSLVFMDLLQPNQDWAVNWPGAGPPPAPSVPPAQAELGVASPGTIDSVQASPPESSFSTEVTMDKPGTLVFSVAYDPGWHAWVDGRPTRTEMLAPALVGVNLAPGRHYIVFRYSGFQWYPELWAFGLLSLAGVFLLGRRWRF